MSDNPENGEVANKPTKAVATVTLLRISHAPRNGVLVVRRQDTSEILHLPEAKIPPDAYADGQVVKSFHIPAHVLSGLKEIK